MSSGIIGQHARFLGDGVYASIDANANQIWLQTLEGNRIALEPEVLANLVKYDKDMRERAKGSEP